MSRVCVCVHVCVCAYVEDVAAEKKEQLFDFAGGNVERAQSLNDPQDRLCRTPTRPHQFHVPTTCTRAAPHVCVCVCQRHRLPRCACVCMGAWVHAPLDAMSGAWRKYCSSGPISRRRAAACRFWGERPTIQPNSAQTSGRCTRTVQHAGRRGHAGAAGGHATDHGSWEKLDQLHGERQRHGVAEGARAVPAVLALDNLPRVLI
jgi:hypothetical protein